MTIAYINVFSVCSIMRIYMLWCICNNNKKLLNYCGKDIFYGSGCCCYSVANCLGPLLMFATRNQPKKSRVLLSSWWYERFTGFMLSIWTRLYASQITHKKETKKKSSIKIYKFMNNWNRTKNITAKKELWKKKHYVLCFFVVYATK